MYSLYNVKGRRPIPMVRGKKIHPGCCEDSYFPKGKCKLFNSLFHSLYIAVMYQEFVVCNVRSAKGFMGYDKQPSFIWINKGDMRATTGGNLLQLQSGRLPGQETTRRATSC